MSSHDRTLLVVVLLVLLVGAIVVPTVLARPPPQPLCEVCDDDVIDSTLVTDTTVTITVDADGLGHWNVRVSLAPNATVDPERVRTAAASTLTGHHAAAEPKNLSTVVTESNVRFSYDVPAMARDSFGGVQVVDYFYGDGDSGQWFGVNADRVVVRAADDATLVRAPTRFESNDTALVLEGAYGDPFARTVDSDWQLAFADSDGPLTRIAATIGEGVTVARGALADVPEMASLPTLVLVVGLLAGRRRAGHPDRSSNRRLGEALAISAALLAVATVTVAAAIEGGLGNRIEGAVFSLVMATLAWWLPVAGVAGVVGALVLRSPGIAPSLSSRRLDAGVVGLALLLLAAPLSAGNDGSLGRTYATVVAFAAGILFDSLRTARGRQAVTLGVILVLTPALIVLGLGPHGLTMWVHPVALYLPWALAVAVAGTFARELGGLHLIEA